MLTGASIRETVLFPLVKPNWSGGAACWAAAAA